MSYVRRPYTARVQAVGQTYDPAFLRGELQRIQAGIPLAIVVDGRDFGLKDGSRGTNDDTSALRNAVNQAATAGASTATGAVVNLPPGLIALESYVNPARGSNIALKGAGQSATTLRAVGVESLLTNFPAPDSPTPWSDPQTSFLASNIGVMDCTLDMDYDNNPDNGVLHPTRGTTHSYPADNWQYPVYMNYIEGLWFSNVRFYRSWFNGIEAYSCNRVIVDSRCWFDHCGDKANYTGGNYSAAEVDGYSHDVVFDGRVTNCGNGWDINAVGPNHNPDGIVGTRRVWMGGSIYNSTKQGIAAQGRITGLTIETQIEKVGTYGIAIAAPETAVEGATGPQHVRISCSIVDANTSGMDGVAAIQAEASNLLITNTTIRMGTPLTGGAFFGITTRQLQEKVSGVLTKRSGTQILGVTMEGSFNNGKGVLAEGEYTRVDNVMIHDTSGTMIAPVTNAATGSTTGSVTVIP